MVDGKLPREAALRAVGMAVRRLVDGRGLGGRWWPAAAVTIVAAGEAIRRRWRLARRWRRVRRSSDGRRSSMRIGGRRDVDSVWRKAVGGGRCSVGAGGGRGRQRQGGVMRRCRCAADSGEARRWRERRQRRWRCWLRHDWVLNGRRILSVCGCSALPEAHWRGAIYITSSCCRRPWRGILRHLGRRRQRLEIQNIARRKMRLEKLAAMQAVGHGI